jgi:hypothetical protein
MSKVAVRPAIAGSRWLDVMIGERVYASFRDELLAKRFAQRLSRLKSIELQNGPAIAKVGSVSGTFAIGSDGIIRKPAG